jgi:gluconolactonase
MLTIIVLSTFLTSAVVAVNNTIVSLSPTLTYLLPPFQEDLASLFVNGTHTNNDTINKELAVAAAAPFISYSKEFSDIIGNDAKIELVEKRDTFFAFEAGVWLPDRNEVWFASSTFHPPGHFEVLDLETNKISNITASQKV